MELMQSGRNTSVSTGLTTTSTLRVADLPSFLPSASHNCLASSPIDHVQWYSWWVHDQVQREPKELFSSLPGYDPKSNQHYTDPFTALWQETSRYLAAKESVSILEIVTHLVEEGLLQSQSGAEALVSAKNLVFAVIGWQTMLYKPDMHSCPAGQLAIADEMDGHQGQAHMCLKQNGSACKRHIHELLLGFGVLLPPRNFHAPASPEDNAAFNELKTAAPATFNAHLLTSIGGIDIKWTDSLACHLEFDKNSNTLFLYRYPSFCVAHLPPSKSTTPHKTVIHACAAPDTAGTKQWATADEVTQMLREIILSYRLLFGQNKAARQRFRKLRPFDDIPAEGTDNLLSSLCGRKHCQSTFDIPERETYDLPRDFPVLRSRLAILLRHLSNRKPRTWKELWQDKRDSASWLTFWAVLIIGGMGIILAFLQVVLQIVQIVQRD
ncbi:hypothetical protein H2201_000590 [Coniosporium apollinis]|uniref:Uncharacterized protein n=2 Tax=Coniosporium TaxID=2810619 RepID=A0ABQ9P4M3_9PEZI|nr:hypothetical protein H2199_001141 [Cladosporium sp. JES 115]KAJ9669238.1 hypothetical protein H2201_000590 [Coniosporium apollinis]